MRLYTSYGSSADRRAIDEAINALREGKLIIYPTDTLYAIGCDGLNNRAIERLCSLKGINPDKNLLSVVCAEISDAAQYARIDNRAFRLLKENLPGPFTFVLPASTQLPKAFKGRKTVGIRIPDNVFARELAREFGNPILTSSVSLEDEDIDITSAEALADHYSYVQDIAMTIDGGEGKTEGSTVVDCTNSNEPEIIRQGLGDISL